MLTGSQKSRLKGPVLPNAPGEQKTPKHLKQHHITGFAANLTHTTTNPVWPFPRNKLHLILSTGCGFSSPFVAWHLTSVNLQTISSHTYGYTVIDTPQLLQIPHLHWQVPCCETSSRALSLTYSAMKVKLKSRSSMYSAFCVGHFCVDLTQLYIVEEGTLIENMPQPD